MGARWEFSIKGFGPFGVKSSVALELPETKATVYAGNGQGKTCLSRLIRAAENGPGALNDSIVSKGVATGTFELALSENDSAARTLRVTKKRSAAAEVDNDTEYLFHVFNSDYVRENLAAANYAPSGDIEGYIIGRSNIDVSDKKQRLEELKSHGERLRAEIDGAIEEAKATLRSLGVTRNTKEYKEMTFENVAKLDVVEDDYNEKLAEYEALRDLPEDMPALAMLEFRDNQVDLESLPLMLESAYTRDVFSEEFLDAISAKQSFIADGMRIESGDTCPFCGRTYDDDARALIHRYEEYLAGKEARIVEALQAQARELDSLVDSYLRLFRAHLVVLTEYDARKVAFAPFKETELPALPATEDFKAHTAAVAELVSQKCLDISKAVDADAVRELENLLGFVERTVAETNLRAGDLNAATQKSKSAQTALRKSLCAEMAKRVRAEKTDAIEQRNLLMRQFVELRQEIRLDESQGKRAKRDVVAEALTALLHEMFDDKYVFDEERFAILFNEDSLGDEAERVLSDGEKSALAFCHYVASTFELLESDDDAQRLFFVIDDPVTSLDRSHILNVIRIINGLGARFGLQQTRLLIFTHNSGFFNMLAKSGVTSGNFLLQDGMVSLPE